MKTTILFLFACSAYLMSCTSTEKSETTAETLASSPKLEKAWETDTTLTTPESVIYDAVNAVLYVSCIGAVPPDNKDGDGYIAKVGLDGKIIENKWVTGLDGPKGMGISGDTLYVTDIDKLVAISIKSGKIISKIPIPGSRFLNDVDAAGGEIFATCTATNTLYKLNGTTVAVVLQDSTLGGLNGIYCDGSRKVLASFGSGQVYTLSDNKVTVVVDSLPGGDGLEKYEDGFFVSNWNGEVYYLDKNWAKTKLIDTKDKKENAADIEVVATKKLLFIPAFFANKVVAYTIN